MPPRIISLRSLRAVRLPIRSAECNVERLPARTLVPRRNITADEKPLPVKGGEGPGAGQTEQPHVTEEAIKTAEIMGETPPDLTQGTPVQEVCQSLYCYKHH